MKRQWDTLSANKAILLEKMHEDDQCESKESLAQLNKSIINYNWSIIYNDEAFEINPLKPPGFDVLIGKLWMEKDQ